MTRLDATSEPSMEDILASIRKIIAEDPPGSRATPAPAANLGRPMPQRQQTAAQQTAAQQTAAQQTPEPASLRGSTRETFFPLASQPVAAPAAFAPEPYLRAEPQKPAPAAFDTDAFFAKSPSKPFVPDASPARIEPSFAQMAQTPMTQPRATPEAPAAALSVDAQLSDLLGDALPAGLSSATAPATALPDLAAPASSSPFAGFAPSRAAPLPSAEAAPVGDLRQGPRQGFTVSRDGFVPGQVTAEPAAERDPFDFDLGPSPFEARTTAAQSSRSGAVQTSGSERSSSFGFGGVVPARTVETPSAAVAASMASEHASAPPQSAAPDAGTATSFELRAATETPAVVSAAPSVAATIAPDAIVPSRSSEPIARFVPANASVDTPKAVERDVMEVVSHEPPVVVSAHAPSTDIDAVSETIAASAGVPMTQAGAQQRTMEDTVADLLRPMLRTWLAENMPRIVERALLREITEQLGGDKQEAAE